MKIVKHIFVIIYNAVLHLFAFLYTYKNFGLLPLIAFILAYILVLIILIKEENKNKDNTYERDIYRYRNN